MSLQPPPGMPPPAGSGGWRPPEPGGGGLGTPAPPSPSGWPPPAGPAGPPWRASPPPARRSHRGLVTGLGLGGAALLLLLVVGLATVADRASGGTSLAALRRGQCFNTAKALVAEKADRVNCAKAHAYQVAGLLRFPSDRDASYAGRERILDLGRRECPQQEREFLGTASPSRPPQVFVFGPNKAAWQNGDRTVVCSLREPNGAKRTGSFLDG